MRPCRPTYKEKYRAALVLTYVNAEKRVSQLNQPVESEIDPLALIEEHKFRTLQSTFLV